MPLDPEVAAYLESQKGRPPRSSLTVEQTRAMMSSAGLLASRPAVARIDELPDARQYWPEDDPRLPLVVYLHGGRFFSGDLETEFPGARVTRTSRREIHVVIGGGNAARVTAQTFSGDVRLERR